MVKPGAKPKTKKLKLPVKEQPRRVEPKWRFREFYEHLGAMHGIASVIEAAGYKPPPLMTIRGWLQRGSIPARWLLVILWSAHQTNSLTEALLFLHPGKED